MKLKAFFWTDDVYSKRTELCRGEGRLSGDMGARQRNKLLLPQFPGL